MMRRFAFASLLVLCASGALLEGQVISVKTIPLIAAGQFAVALSYRLGMGIALRPGVDLSRTFPGDGAWIDDVRHKTFVQVDEEGTEAAAVTVVVMMSSSAGGASPADPGVVIISTRLDCTPMLLL